ncbi:MAG: molybdopterin-dependent oxidoreductase [Phycisphaerales bacterium]
MPQITIDGKLCEFQGKKSILEVALENGIEIPHYCYHPGMSVVASCRICMAEVEAPNPRNDNKLEMIPKLMPTCQTPAGDGQVVHTKSPKSVANQKQVMEFLLINHPLDCPVCDQAGECYLQDYSYKYGRSESRFDETKIKQPKKDIGEHVLLYSDRCIMCTRCVRFAKEVSGTGEIGIFGRGSSEQIDVFPGKPLNNELSGNVVDICPVGALLDKDFLMSMRVWNLKKTPSIDGITASGDNISVEHNDGRVYRVKPRTNMDVNKWWTSDEIRFGWKFVHSEDRHRSPLVKTGEGQTECDWNKAYDAVKAGLTGVLESRGTGSLAVMVSPMLTCEEAYLLGKLIVGLDADAVIGVGPVPVSGQDKTFPGGYTISAEKCPNARGVRRALGQITESVLDYEQFLTAIEDERTAAVVLTGNYPSHWVTPDLAKAVNNKYLVLIDTLPNTLTERADVLLPGATFIEKSGTFENYKNRLQSFDRAFLPIEFAKAEGQIALDLLARLGLGDPKPFDAHKTRIEMGDAFVTDVHHPSASARKVSDMQVVEL